MALLVAASRNAFLGLLMVGVEILVVLGVRQLGLHADALRLSLEKRRRGRELLQARTRLNRQDRKDLEEEKIADLCGLRA